MKIKEKHIITFIFCLLFLVTVFLYKITVENDLPRKVIPTADLITETVSSKRTYQIEDFKASDVAVTLDDKTVSAVNHFALEDDTMVFAWYINRIDDGFSHTNIYKTDGWSETRSFDYTFDESSTGNNYILIAYVKEKNSDERVSRIAAEIAAEENGQLSLTGAPLDEFSSGDITVEWDNNALTAVNHFDPYGPQLYTWYVYQNDTDHLIFKQEDWSEDNTFHFEGYPNSSYIIGAYIRDALNNRINVTK